jgi:hypothetical protein
MLFALAAFLESGCGGGPNSPHSPADRLHHLRRGELQAADQMPAQQLLVYLY